jgi:hypothetical protein
MPVCIFFFLSAYWPNSLYLLIQNSTFSLPITINPAFPPSGDCLFQTRSRSMIRNLLRWPNPEPVGAQICFWLLPLFSEALAVAFMSPCNCVIGSGMTWQVVTRSGKNPLHIRNDVKDCIQIWKKWKGLPGCLDRFPKDRFSSQTRVKGVMPSIILLPNLLPTIYI